MMEYILPAIQCGEWWCDRYLGHPLLCDRSAYFFHLCTYQCHTAHHRYQAFGTEISDAHHLCHIHAITAVVDMSEYDDGT